MVRALDLARRGPAHGPNPRVGAVLLDAAGRVLGEGWHRGAGTAHAEVAALDAARSAGHDPHGATMVVTLEPCRHTGRTGPCVDALLAAGVARVVHAVADPSALAGGGALALRSGGVDVASGVLEAEGRALLRPWLTAVGRGRPWVTLKTASTLDGRVAAADGSSRWITSQAARRHAHAMRAEVDAIVVGTGTALTDDPALTARDDHGKLAPHQPLRVVAGNRPVPEGARLRGPAGPWYRSRGTTPPRSWPTWLRARSGTRSWRAARRGGAFLRAGVVDEVHAYLAPAFLGAGAAAVADLGVRSVAGALRLHVTDVERIGADVLVVARTEED